MTSKEEMMAFLRENDYAIQKDSPFCQIYSDEHETQPRLAFTETRGSNVVLNIDYLFGIDEKHSERHNFDTVGRRFALSGLAKKAGVKVDERNRIDALKYLKALNGDALILETASQ